MRISGMLNAVEIPCFASHLYDQLKKKKKRKKRVNRRSYREKENRYILIVTFLVKIQFDEF